MMIMRSVRYIIPVIISSFLLLGGNSYAQQTPAYDVVSEYVRQLGTMNDVQELGAKEMAASNNNIMDAIRGSTRIKLELRRNVLTFKTMKIDSRFEWLLPGVIDLYEQKIELHEQAIEIESKFTGGTPQPGVDYRKLTAEMPKITATLEYIDKSQYDMTPAFCLLLVDQKPDSKGKLSRLVITRAQRQQLVRQIDLVFGNRLSVKNPNYTVGSAALMRKFLMDQLGTHKSADDPS